ncbi:MAG: IgGFc-binding protein [Deltaproteobacteria bacterium]|nr:IgGFc-binding protein [Deltaproteobacteria bacterium]
MTSVGKLIALLMLAALSACDVGGEIITLPPLRPEDPSSKGSPFRCYSEDTVKCIGKVHHSCESVGEFLQEKTVDCAAKDLVCVPNDLVCAVCVPGTMRCEGNSSVRCAADGNGFDVVEVCDTAKGFQCVASVCENMCETAEKQRSYVGCEFYAADLDNAAIDAIDDASKQQYAVVVSNLHSVPIEVFIEVNDASPGEPVRAREVARVTVPPNDLEVFELPRREVDGSSEDGINDGTHTALSSNAYRIESSHPIIAYQFNPLDNVNVFSNEASLLLPTSAIGDSYTVVGWPQTIGHSEDPQFDFDHTSADEDLRSFLTIIGTHESTRLELALGPGVIEVEGASPIPALGPGDTFELEIGPFDVVNLETQGFNADFTGTLIEASHPVSVFVGSEASDAPYFLTYATRQCCADHLEEQLFPNAALGKSYVISRMPSRTSALNAAFVDPEQSVAEVNEPEYVRIVAVEEGKTGVLTTLDVPYEAFTIDYRGVFDIEATRDFMIIADKRIAVLQTLPSQQVVGIDKAFPGGDPSIIAVPPVEQYRADYIFLTPNKYAFDFVTITADPDTEVILDGVQVAESCSAELIDGTLLSRKEPLPSKVVYRCQLSFPRVTDLPKPTVLDGDQSDGVHKLIADQPVGLVVFGFDRFVSYAYAGGLNLELIY